MAHPSYGKGLLFPFPYNTPYDTDYPPYSPASEGTFVTYYRLLQKIVSKNYNQLLDHMLPEFLNERLDRAWRRFLAYMAKAVAVSFLVHTSMD